ncbi:PRD domain-containing protein [Brevibacillus fluminis]|uniref:PRD domain-containing protein n=1 Tax=Brevibacillus fluminis TaxID=511487 RepID=A0A3M8DQH1_9BACL|nr:sigma 54-interacting transcriptional regulator [Brevibacillus fluminis]RNB90386.1 PRD domain-containing protein [Brevibacillus fluminis]
MNKDIIYEHLKVCTIELDFTNEDYNNERQWLACTSGHIAETLGKKRNAVSQALTELVRGESVLKINTRPVYFFCKETVEQKLNMAIGQHEFQSKAEFFDYLRHSNRRTSDPFARMIGYNNTIHYEIEQCKVAVNYPPSGLPVLIHGATGVGKSLLAQLMYEYALDRDLIDRSAPFIVVNCSEFANNPELLTANLFGYMKGAFTGAAENKTGFIEEAHNGFLFLDEIHRLSPEGQEKLFLFMDKGVFRRLGETQGWRKAKVRLAFATTEQLQEVLIQTFLRRIPIIVKIPSLKERSFQEKVEIISTFFAQESGTIKRTLLIQKQVMNLLAGTEYVGNIGELRNIVKYTCANAFYQAIGNHAQTAGSKTLSIMVSHIPDDFIEKSSIRDKMTSKDIPFDDLVIQEQHRENDVSYVIQAESILTEMLDQLNGIYDNFAKDILEHEECIADANKVIDTALDQIVGEINKSFLGYMKRFAYIRKVMDSLLQLVTEKSGWSLYSNTANVFSHYVFFRTRKGYDNQKGRAKKAIDLIERVKNLYAKEYEVAVTLTELIKTHIGVDLTQEDIALFTIYIKGTNKNLDVNRIRAIIISHGHSTASSIAHVANRLLGQYVFESLDMPFDTSIEQITTQLVDYVKQVNTGNGIIILVDMGSLEEIHMSLDGLVDGTVGIINNITTYLALKTGSKILGGLDVDEIVKQVTEDCQPRYALMKNEREKKKAIVTTCMTGIGTADKITDLLKKALEDYPVDVDIFSYDYLRLKNNGKNDRIFQQYQVMGIIGTADPKVDIVPFIALEDIMLEKSTEQLGVIFKEVVAEEEIGQINKKMIKLFSLQSVINHVTILNPDKVMNYIELVTDQLQAELGIEFGNSTKIRLFVHLSCLVERLVKNDSINTYENLEEFAQCQKLFISNVKKCFSVIEDVYNVTIPVTEIGYIFDIISLGTDKIRV